MLLWGTEFVGLEPRTRKNRGLSQANLLRVGMPRQLLVVLNLRGFCGGGDWKFLPQRSQHHKLYPRALLSAKHGFFSSQP